MTTNDAANNDPYALFARYYDDEFGQHTDDLDFYRQFAIEAGGPVLELGCGSGRALAALLDTDLPLTGIDNSEAMLRLARHRLPERVALVRADMTRLDVAPLEQAPFWLAFSAINTFLHLPDDAAQLAALRAIRRVVTSGGLLLLDLLAPEPQYLASLDGRLAPEFTTTLPSGDRLDKLVSRTHDFASQTIETTVYFDTTDAASGALTRAVDRYSTRYLHRFELEHLLERAGWRLISLYGSYDLEPFASDAERMIALATWGAPDDGED